MREEFNEKLISIPSNLLVFLDESGIEDNVCLEYGWSMKGTRCYGEMSYQHKRRISMIAGLCNNKIIAPIIFEGTCDKEVFETYVETVLIKELTPGQLVVMDNINFHKTDRVAELIKSVGCSVLFLPTYSPDLNPIEHHWFRIKRKIRKITPLFTDFYEAVYEGMRLSLP